VPQHLGGVGVDLVRAARFVDINAMPGTIGSLSDVGRDRFGLDDDQGRAIIILDLG
jgi:hypothetical protein